MKQVLSGLLVVCGFFAYYISKLNRVALGKYKTVLVKRRNPNIGGIGWGTYWNLLKQVHIGANTYINGAELITTNETEITIGDNCLISYDVVMRTDTHNFADLKRPIIEQGSSAQSILIGNNVWIGQGAYIMPGVKIGDNSIVGASAVVTRDIPANVIVGGCPAEVIRAR